VKVLITGGAGFIGTRLARAILARGELADGRGAGQRVEELVLFDRAAPAEPIVDDRARYLSGDLTDPDSLAAALGDDTDTIFHLAAVVSGAAEADLGLGLSVNLDGTRALLDLAARSERRPKFLFASSLAVYGGPGATKVTDATIPTPMSSYGVQKLCCEYLIGDCDRRGLVDGRSMRFPTIAVRPGAPNAANSSFISSVIREPVAGEPTVCPVPDDEPIAVMSPDRLVAAILKVHDMPTETFGWPRSLLLPAVKVTVAEMLEALEALMGPEARRRVRFEPDEKILPMVRSWPAEVTSARAAGFGIETDADAMAFVSQYVAEYGPKT